MMYVQEPISNRLLVCRNAWNVKLKFSLLAEVSHDEAKKRMLRCERPLLAGKLKFFFFPETRAFIFRYFLHRSLLFVSSTFLTQLWALCPLPRTKKRRIEVEEEGSALCDAVPLGVGDLDTRLVTWSTYRTKFDHLWCQFVRQFVSGFPLVRMRSS